MSRCSELVYTSVRLSALLSFHFLSFVLLLFLFVCCVILCPLSCCVCDCLSLFLLLFSLSLSLPFPSPSFWCVCAHVCVYAWTCVRLTSLLFIGRWQRSGTPHWKLRLPIGRGSWWLGVRGQWLTTVSMLQQNILTVTYKHLIFLVIYRCCCVNVFFSVCVCGVFCICVLCDGNMNLLTFYLSQM